MLYGATKADLLSFTERLVQCARHLADIAPGQTFMISRGGSDADPHHHHTHYAHAQPVLRSASSTVGGGGSFAGTIKKTSPHPTGKTPERLRKRGSTGSGGGQSRNTPPPAVVSSSTPLSRPKASAPFSARPVAAGGAESAAVKTVVPVMAEVKAAPGAPAAGIAPLTTKGEVERGKERLTASTPRVAQQQQNEKKAANTLVDMDMDVDSSPEKPGVDGMLTLQQGLRRELERQRRAAEAHQAPGGHGDGSSSAVDCGITGAAPSGGQGPVGDNGRGSTMPGASVVGAAAVPSAAPPIAQAPPNPSPISQHHQPAQQPGVVDRPHPKVSQTSHNPPTQNLAPGPGPPGLAPSGQTLLPPIQVPGQQLQQQQVDPSILPHQGPSLLSESITSSVQQQQPQHPPPMHQQQLQQHHGHLQPPPVQPGHFQPPRPPPPQLQLEQLQQVQQQQQPQQPLLQQPPPPLEQHPGSGFASVGLPPSNPPVSSPPVPPPLLDIPQPQYQQPYQHGHAQGAFPFQDTENNVASNVAMNNGSGSGSGSGTSSGHFQGPIHEPQYYRGAEHSGRSSAGSASTPDGGGIGAVGPFHEEEEGVPYRQSPEPEYPGASSHDDSGVLSEPLLRSQEAHQQPLHFRQEAQQQQQQQQHLTSHGEMHSGDASGIPLPPEQEQRATQGDAYGLDREPSVGGLPTTTNPSNVEAGDGQGAGPWQQQQQMGTGAWGPGPGRNGVTGTQIDDHEGGTVGPVRRDGAEVQGDASYLEEVLAPSPVVGQQGVPGSLDHDRGWEQDPEVLSPRFYG